MLNDAKLVTIKAITPVHAGTGRELGLIDMPIQRESHTGIPKIEGSTIKGCIKEAIRMQREKGKYKEVDIEYLFGSDNGSKPGAIGFTDAKLLLYPVISMKNIFSYITCPYIINRFIEDLNIINENKDNIKKVENVTEGKAHRFSVSPNKETEVILDVYRFSVIDVNENIEKCFTSLQNRYDKDREIYVLNNDDFVEMVQINREIITRNRIDNNTGVVVEGGLFTEEYLPAESIMYTLHLKNPLYWNDNKIEIELPEAIQIGGNATIGKGIVQLKYLLKGE